MDLLSEKRKTKPRNFQSIRCRRFKQNIKYITISGGGGALPPGHKRKGMSMKLFQVSYLENNDDVSYLTVGNDNDTEETIEKREYEKRND